jgi:hypothetical protein
LLNLGGLKSYSPKRMQLGKVYMGEQHGQGRGIDK